MIELRKPRLEDGPEIFKMITGMTENDHEKCGGFPLRWTACEDFESWLKADEMLRAGTFKDHQKLETFLSFEGKNLVGFCVIFTEERKKCPFFDFGVVNYYIRPEFRGRGLGTAQLRAILPMMASFGFSDFHIMAKEDNLESRKVIEKCGGKFQGGTVQDLVLYQFSAQN